jgi:hypothetical protein
MAFKMRPEFKSAPVKVLIMVASKVSGQRKYNGTSI